MKRALFQESIQVSVFTQYKARNLDPDLIKVSWKKILPCCTRINLLECPLGLLYSSTLFLDYFGVLIAMRMLLFVTAAVRVFYYSLSKCNCRRQENLPRIQKPKLLNNGSLWKMHVLWDLYHLLWIQFFQTVLKNAKKAWLFQRFFNHFY